MPSTLSRRIVALTASLVLVLAACGSDDAADSASVAFTEPTDGATVSGSLAMAMTAEGITIEEAGEVRDNAGHFHVIADDGCTEPGAAVARDADHVHFGAGQAEGTIYLSPGTHELCLQAGDGAHVALDATDRVTVEVGITDRDQWCAVIEETDELFAESDTDGDDFPIVQVSYENIRRLIAQLEDGLDQVDAADRELVATSLAFADRIAESITAATDAADAERLLEPVFESGEEEINAGAPWILDNCDVDIDG